MHVSSKFNGMAPLALSKLKKKSSKVPKKTTKIDRFNGLTEEEIQQNSPPLPDYLKMNLDLVFVGINPSLTAAYRGRYYAGPGNHFYKLLHESGLVSRFVNFEEDHQLLEFGIGLTNIVDRATRSSADLSKAEFKQGSATVERKLREFKPKVAVFNGRCIFDVFANKTAKSAFNFGLQPERVGETALWVVPSSSARCSNFPRMVDKLPFYQSLKKYLAFVKGEIDQIDVKEFYFESKKRKENEPSRMWKGKSLFFNAARITNENTSSSEIADDGIAFVSNEFVIKEIRSQEGVEIFQEKSSKLEKAECGFEEEKCENSDNKTQDSEGKKHLRGDENSKDDRILNENKDCVAKIACVRKRKEREVVGANNQIFRNSVVKSTDFRIREREQTSDFVNLIKRRIETKKRKIEDFENFEK